VDQSANIVAPIVWTSDVFLSMALNSLPSGGTIAGGLRQAVMRRQPVDPERPRRLHLAAVDRVDAGADDRACTRPR
jgi:hypothetical protein